MKQTQFMAFLFLRAGVEKKKARTRNVFKNFCFHVFRVPDGLGLRPTNNENNSMLHCKLIISLKKSSLVSSQLPALYIQENP